MTTGLYQVNQAAVRRRLVKSVVMPIVLLATVVLILVWLVLNLLSAARWVDHCDQVIAQANDAQERMLLMQSGMRGYLLTGRAEFLGLYGEVRPTIEPSLERLSTLAADNPEQVQRLGAIRSAYEAWAVAAETMMGLRSSGGDFSSLLNAAVAKRPMEHLRDQFTALINHEEQLRSERSGETHRDTKLLVGVGAILILVGGVVIGAFSRRQLVRVSESYGYVLDQMERSANALRTSEQEYRILFENNPLPMWVFDREALAFLRVNQAAVVHYGYTGDEFLAMTIKDIRPEDDLPELLNVVSNPNEGLILSGQWRHLKKDGSIIIVEISSHTISFAGRPAQLVLANDVTERKLAEQEIKTLNAELEGRVLERTAQLEATAKELEAFSYSVSHDLRSPLRAIDGFSRILLEEYGPRLGKEPREYLHIVRENAQKMGDLIDDLLAFSRLGRKPLQKRTVAPGKILESALEDLANERAGRNVELKISELPECEADPALLKQVFANLLSNGLKYSRPRDVARIEIGCLDNGRVPDQHTYFVKDNGVGFDMKYKDKLFGVFQRLHLSEEFEGTGVGLAIVQRIVHAHGGQVWAEAEPNKGASFYFTLPGGNPND